MDVVWLCFVGQCKEHAVVCSDHKRFGRVAACEGHSPMRHGYAKALAPEIVVKAAKPAERQGGQVVMACAPAPTMPPMGDVDF